MGYIFMLKQNNATKNPIQQVFQAIKFSHMNIWVTAAKRLCTRSRGAWEGSMEYCLFPCLQTNQPQANAGIRQVHLRDCGLSRWISGLLPEEDFVL